MGNVYGVWVGLALQRTGRPASIFGTFVPFFRFEESDDKSQFSQGKVSHELPNNRRTID